jgi:homoserine kinase
MTRPGDFAPFTVSVPATTANLGPGFDCLGLALDLWNHVMVFPSATLELTIAGEGAGQLPVSARNLVYEAAVHASRKIGSTLPPLRLEANNAVPLTRGLGSSAAATIAGVLIADQLAGNVLDREEQLALAANLEGHADNAAPAIWGGACLSIEVPDSRNIVRTLPFPDGLSCVLLVPDMTMSTKESRSVLPRRVPRADAVFNVGRVALLVRALATGDWDDLRLATEDRLHQPQRASLMPATTPLIASAYDAGASGAFLSGAGPTVLALSQPDLAQQVVDAMKSVARKRDLPARSFIVAPSEMGATVAVLG